MEEVQTPDWVKHAVFYQIFPDRFARGGRSPLPPTMQVPLEAWDAPPTLTGYKGGTLWGVIDRLDYLQALGITALYFTPIFQSASNHRYHTHDYYQVDPLLGGNAAFADLLSAVHDRGLKIVLDGVFNHASRGFFYFNDILENGPASPWVDWFLIKGWPLSAYDGRYPANYMSWAGNRSLPKFNHDHPAVREYLMQVGEYWIRQGIDGWRLDVPEEITAPGFWQEFRDRIKALNPEAYLVGEIWHEAQTWLTGDQFDGVMNYLFTGPTMAFAAGDRVVRAYAERPDYDPYPALDAAGYRAKMEALLALYPWEIQLTQLNLLSSHDTARALTVMGEDEASLRLCVLLQMTFPGAPCVYYGDEVGMRGGLDPDCRRGFPPESAWNQDLLAYHRELIALRHRHPALRTGSYIPCFAEGSVYGFQRQEAGETVMVWVNGGTTAQTLEKPPGLPTGDTAIALLHGDLTLNHTSPETASITIPARAGGILGWSSALDVEAKP